MLVPAYILLRWLSPKPHPRLYYTILAAPHTPTICYSVLGSLDASQDSNMPYLSSLVILGNGDIIYLAM